MRPFSLDEYEKCIGYVDIAHKKLCTSHGKMATFSPITYIINHKNYNRIKISILPFDNVM